MSRHPFSREWGRVVAFFLAAFAVFGVFLWTHSYVLAIGALFVTVVGMGIYLIGNSSDLPGTAGDRDKNVPT